MNIMAIENEAASARLSLFGGQVLSFQPKKDGRERLYVSRAALFDGSKPIRGGIPICWPWFAAHPADPSCPFHGYVRNRLWTLIEETAGPDATTILLKPTDTCSPCFSGIAGLLLQIRVADTLSLELITRNTGDTDVTLTCAMHTYFAVSDIRQTRLEGLKGQYADKVQDFDLFETPSTYDFTAETDRIHLMPCPEVKITEPGAATLVKSAGHDSIVVWNPWTACHDNFPDMEPEDYSRMLCVETAVTSGLVIEPGKSHTLRQEIY